MGLEVTIYCDGCSAHGDAGKSASDVRAGLRSIGWRTALPGGRDLCPECGKSKS